MATLKDVAKLACVDISTVSRALSGKTYVHPETKKRIYAAVKELSYQPNLLAKGLRQGKKHNIGVLIPSLSLTIFAEITQGIEIEARRLGYGIMICNTEDNSTVEEECLSRLRNGFVDGIIIAPTGNNLDLLHDIKNSGIPVTQLVRNHDKTLNSVCANYYSCGYDGAKYMISKGCKNIGFINGDLHKNPYRERYRGYQQALKEHNYNESVAKIFYRHNNTFEEGYSGMNYLLDNNKNLDGVIVATDMQGIGAIRALKERGIAIPQSVKLMSLTGHSIGGMLQTAMTSMEMPAFEMGEKVAKMIIEDIESTSITTTSPQHIVFETSLVQRETT